MLFLLVRTVIRQNDMNKQRRVNIGYVLVIPEFTVSTIDEQIEKIQEVTLIRNKGLNVPPSFSVYPIIQLSGVSQHEPCRLSDKVLSHRYVTWPWNNLYIRDPLVYDNDI